MEPCYHIALHPCLKPGGASGCGCRKCATGWTPQRARTEVRFSSPCVTPAKTSVAPRCPRATPESPCLQQWHTLGQWPTP
jgi:hypothetical protein